MIEKLKKIHAGSGYVDRRGYYYKKRQKRCPDCGSFIGRKDHRCRARELQGVRHCVDCGTELKMTGWERDQKICAKCNSKRNYIRLRKLKRKAVELFGGRCQKCGYDAYVECLEFHHKDRGKKEKSGSVRAIKEVLQRPERFKMFCNRCHREYHIDKGDSGKSKLGGVI